jgi:acyl-coenzyme A synthetase/AMP-(fatty) acid ligase
MYGCSESGAIATRQINKGDKWELLEDYDIKANKNNILLKAVGYKNLITISDQIKMIDDRFFYLLGRNSDLVKIGGKRESLSGLSYKLKKIDGVDDGIFFIPKEDTNKRVRANKDTHNNFIQNSIHTHIENILIKYPRMRRQSF